MRNAKRLATWALATGGVIFSATLVTAATTDWPQWRGPNRDAKAQLTAPAEWPKQLTQKWKVTTGASDASPALVGDHLYTVARRGAAEVTLCLNANDGKAIWETPFEPGVSVTGAASPHPGPRASPAVGEGKVVTLGVSGVLSCYDADTGKLVWRKDSSMYPRFYAASSPLIADGVCVAQLGNESKGTVVAFDLADGKPKWTAEGEGTAYASPVLATIDGVKQLVAQTDKALVGLSWADGKQLWKVETPKQRMAQNATSPVVDSSTIYYTGQGSGTKAVQVEKQGDAFATKELWSNDKVGGVFNTPVLKADKLFGLSNMGNYYCLDAKTGKTLWTSPDRHGERGFGSVIDAGSVLVGLTNKGQLVVFKPSDKAFESVATYQVGDAPIYGTPVLSGNRIFVQSQQSMTAFAVE
jgi:outer membrane protein assembly factor BamB